MEGEHFSLNSIYAQKHTPLNRTIYHAEGRLLNGFVYFAEGSGSFSHNGREIAMPEGGLAYLPQGANHRYTATSEHILHIRVDFNITDTRRGEIILFSNTPTVLLESVSPRIREILEELAENSSRLEPGHKLRSRALLCLLLSAVADEVRSTSTNPMEKKILPGIRYIESSFESAIDLRHAAELCSLSESRFRAIFRRVMGMSAFDYREKLRTEKACMLLRSELYRMGEIADMLGYGSVYYFSRSFKKNTGISPSRYKSNRIVQK